MKMTTCVAILGVLLGALFIGGCGVLQKAPDSLATRILVQNRTLAFIDGDSERAAKVQQGAETIKTLVSDRTVRFEALREAADDLIPWDKLLPAERLQMQAVIDSIQAGIQEAQAQKSDPLTDAQKVSLRTIMGWVITAASYVP